MIFFYISCAQFQEKVLITCLNYASNGGKFGLVQMEAKIRTGCVETKKLIKLVFPNVFFIQRKIKLFVVKISTYFGKVNNPYYEE